MKTSSAQEWFRLITVLPLLVVLAGFVFDIGAKPIQDSNLAVLASAGNVSLLVTPLD